MAKFKGIIKEFIPPVILKLKQRFLKPTAKVRKPQWEGDFSTWEEAEVKCTGYEQNTILEKVARSARKIRDGVYPYERDSVLFDEIQHNWTLLTVLFSVYSKEQKLVLLDFGGSLGSVYRQCLPWLKHIPNLVWVVVEQGNFVDLGKREFENEQLKFRNTVEEVIMEFDPNVALVSGVLQYLPNYVEILEKLSEINSVILDRLGVIEGNKTRLTKQNVPDQIYQASYPCYFFSEKEIELNFLNESHTQFASYPCQYTGKVVLGKDTCYWEGRYYIKNEN